MEQAAMYDFNTVGNVEDQTPVVSQAPSMSMMPTDLQSAINKINNIDVNKLNDTLKRLDVALAKLSQQESSSSGLSSLFGGGMSNIVILAIVGVIIYFLFIK
jgi:hypothetical protein